MREQPKTQLHRALTRLDPSSGLRAEARARTALPAGDDALPAGAVDVTADGCARVVAGRTAAIRS